MASCEPSQLQGVTSILQDLDTWLQTAEFKMEAKGDIGRCVAADRRTKLDSLFEALGIRSKIDSKEYGFSVLRIPGPQIARVYVQQGVWADLIPIRVISGNPSSSGRQLLPGWKTHITGAVDVNPALDLLVITPAG